MNTMNRRKFIRTGLTGLAGLSVMSASASNLQFRSPKSLRVDQVTLGNSGLIVSRIAMGTGSIGGNHASNQTRLGMDSFVKLARHAYECGINFYDMADSYGSMPYVGNAIKGLPREKVVLLTKMWTQEDATQREPADKILDRFRSEAGTDYFDILLLHCMMKSNWHETRKYYMDVFSKAKQDGIVKAVGISCHELGALAEAAVNPWVDVIMARINPFGTAMDGTPDAVKAILKTAKKNGKGVIGMKIFGEGKHVTVDERQRSLQYVLTEGNVHCMTLGLESEEQMDDAIERVNKILQI